MVMRGWIRVSGWSDWLARTCSSTSLLFLLLFFLVFLFFLVTITSSFFSVNVAEVVRVLVVEVGLEY